MFLLLTLSLYLFADYVNKQRVIDCEQIRLLEIKSRIYRVL